MTYLELVNGVLTRLREPEAPSIIQSSDHSLPDLRHILFVVNDSDHTVVDRTCHTILSSVPSFMSHH